MKSERLVTLTVLCLFVLSAVPANAESASTPYVITGWAFNESGAPCYDLTLYVSNTNTGEQWQAETYPGNNYYQLILKTANISADDVLEFDATDGAQYNTTVHTVTQEHITDGGIFNFNLTLSSAPSANDPVVDSITITPDDDNTLSGVQIDPYPDANRTVSLSVVVTDPDGWDDIDTVMAVITGPGSEADRSVSLSFVSNSSLTTAAFYGIFNMSFDSTAGEYSVNVTATDKGDLAGSNTENYTYTSCIALSVDAAVVNFGTVDPGENSSIPGNELYLEGSTNGMTVKNTGNVEIDLNVNASDLTGDSGTITNENIYCGFIANDYSLNLGSTTNYDLNLVPGVASYSLVNFRISIPWGTAAGSYIGSLTMTAVT